MSVRIRMKRLGRRHRPFFRICAIDARSPRDGKAIEELGYYDPMVRETDARAVLNGERIDYWLGVGAQPSENVKVLIKKYGSAGTHLDQQKLALERLKIRPEAPPAVPIAKPAPKEEPQAEAAAPAEGAAEASGAEEAGSSDAPSESTDEANEKAGSAAEANE